MLEWLNLNPSGTPAALVLELVVALVLSSLIGLEREMKMKDAGLRTHALVGVAAALIMIVSKHGFYDVLVAREVVLDPSRVAAQIVSGIGFIGGGLIFVHRDVVRGLTTAAVIWLTAAVGMASGAGMIGLAVLVTVLHFVVVSGYAPVVKRILSRHSELLVHYLPGEGAVQEMTDACTGMGFKVLRVSIQRADATTGPGQKAIRLRLRGRRGVEALAVALGDIRGVEKVETIALHEEGG